MDTLQIRLTPVLVEKIDSLVKSGAYASRSDAIRDAVRHYFWQKEAGTVSKKGHSVKLVRKARQKLSDEPMDLDAINRF